VVEWKDMKRTYEFKKTSTISDVAKRLSDGAVLVPSHLIHIYYDEVEMKRNTILGSLMKTENETIHFTLKVSNIDSKPQSWIDTNYKTFEEWNAFYAAGGKETYKIY
jgi:hypothetical protein